MGKLYVVTREDLDLAYQGVQAGHGLAAWLLENPNHHWRNSTLVYLADKDLEHLERWRFKIPSRGLTFSEFKEPDIGNQLTAIACYTDTDIFEKLPLMGEKNAVVFTQ